VIIGFNVFFALIRSFSFAWGGLIAAKRGYRLLTQSTFSTYMSFFESNSLGRIINRFGKDADIVDDQLPFMLNRVLAQVVSSTLMIWFIVIFIHRYLLSWGPSLSYQYQAI
jgi:ATP-binding cassette, subfamily C (CFTR/MRP), member 10